MGVNLILQGNLLWNVLLGKERVNVYIQWTACRNPVYFYQYLSQPLHPSAKKNCALIFCVING